MRGNERKFGMNFAGKPVAFAAIAAALALSACQTGMMRPRTAPIQQTGVEGEWISADGVAISRFNGGVFETVATDTGNRLAEGSYRFRDERTVEISLTSLIRQTTSAVNCALVSPSQMNCTSSSGQQFVLTRRNTGIS